MHPSPIQLLIIDPQNDFCDLPADWYGRDPADGRTLAPALPVAGAHADMLRLADFIDRHAARIDAITITLDSHHRVDIAHPPFWRRGDGEPVLPYTTITAAQVRAGQFVPREAAALTRVLAYLDALEARGRYTLMVWPEHCRVGTWGHLVHPAVQSACDRWESNRLLQVRHVLKGQSPWTEHYSAFEAEVPDAGDVRTALNRELLASLDKADVLLVAGEAGSHCVRASVRDLVEHIPGCRPERIVLLTDCMSPVPGFENEQRAFLEQMAALGVQLQQSTDR